MPTTDRSTDWCAPVSYLQEIAVLRGSLPVIADAEDVPGLQHGPASLKALEFLDNLGARRVTRIKDVEVAVVLNNKRAAPRGAGGGECQLAGEGGQGGRRGGKGRMDAPILPSRSRRGYPSGHRGATRRGSHQWLGVARSCSPSLPCNSSIGPGSATPPSHLARAFCTSEAPVPCGDSGPRRTSLGCGALARWRGSRHRLFPPRWTAIPQQISAAYSAA